MKGSASVQLIASGPREAKNDKRVLLAMGHARRHICEMPVKGGKSVHNKRQFIQNAIAFVTWCTKPFFNVKADGFYVCLVSEP
jgi:hypothetical protein